MNLSFILAIHIHKLGAHPLTQLRLMLSELETLSQFRLDVPWRRDVSGSFIAVHASVGAFLAMLVSKAMGMWPYAIVPAKLLKKFYNPMEIEMDIDKVLQSANLDARLIPEDLSDNPWFDICQQDLSELCKSSLDTPLHFTFNISHSIQAQILYRSRLVVMYGGMFNAFCRLASKIVSSGAFIEFEGGVEPEWSMDQCSEFAPVLPGLKAAMHWKLDSSKWNHQPERQVLYMYLVLALSRFVTLHEIGHVYHGHDKRFADRNDEICDVDTAGPTLLPLEESIPSQAREILADNFAFIRLRKIMTKELFNKATTPAAKLLRAKLLGDENKITRFALHVAHLYFHMMDRHDWMVVDYRKMTHPPSPFRQQNLYAVAQDLGLQGMSVEEAGEYLAETHQASEMLVAVVHKQPPPFALQGRYEQVGFAELYQMIHDEFPNWCRT